VLIILAVICIILLLRVGVYARYGEGDLLAYARIGFVKIRVYPRPEKPQKKKKEKRKKEKKAPADEAEADEKKGGKVSNLKEWISIISNALSNVKKRLRVKRLIIYYTVAAEDAASAAMMYGGANAVVGALLPVIENNFNVKRRDIRIGVDFEEKEPKIYVEGVVSIAIWEVIYIAAVFGYNAINKGKLKKQKGGV